MYLPYEITRITQQMVSDPRRFFMDKLIGAALLMAAMPAFALFMAISTRVGQDWEWIASLPSVLLIAHLACGAVVLGGLGCRSKVLRPISLSFAIGGLAASMLIGTFMLLACV